MWRHLTILNRLTFQKIEEYGFHLSWNITPFRGSTQRSRRKAAQTLDEADSACGGFAPLGCGQKAPLLVRSTQGCGSLRTRQASRHKTFLTEETGGA